MAKKKNKAQHPRDFENMDENSIIQQVKDDMEASISFQAPYFEKFDRYYKMYRSYMDEADKNENRSNLYIPYTFQVIETIAPKLVLAIFNTRPYVQTIPLGLASPERERRAEKMNKLLDYQFQHRVKLVQLVTEALKGCLKYGTTITKQTWDFQQKKVKRRRLAKDAMGNDIPNVYETVLYETVVRDDPKMQVIPIKNYYFDPAASDIESSRYGVHEYYEDLHEIEEKAKNAPDMYKNLDKVREKYKALNSSNETPNDPASMLLNIGMGTTKNTRKELKIWEYWTDDWVVKVVEEDILIYSNENPFFHMRKPFARWIDNPVENEFYGIGEPEQIESLQEELNVTRNQRIDNVALIMNKMYKILRGANIDTTQLVSRPAGFIEVDEMTDVEEMKFTDVTQSAYQEEAVIKMDMDRTTGVHDTERGSSPTRRETATTMNILANAGNERFKLKTLLMEYGGLHEAINQIVWLNQQYIDRPREVLLLGDDNKLVPDEVKPEDIMGNYLLVAVGSSVEPTVNKTIEQQNLVQLLGIVKGAPFINQPNFVRRVFEKYGLKNLDELFQQQEPPPPPMIPWQPAGASPQEGLPDMMYSGLPGGIGGEQVE